MYKLAALTCTAIGLFALGTVQLSKNLLQMAPISIDFETKHVMGSFVVQNTSQKAIHGGLRISNESKQSIKLDLNKFRVTSGKLHAVIKPKLAIAHVLSESDCEPIQGLNDHQLVELNSGTISNDSTSLLVEPGETLELKVKFIFDQDIRSGNLEITYPLESIGWLSNTIA